MTVRTRGSAHWGGTCGAALVICLVALRAMEAGALTSLVAHSPEGKTAWAVVREREDSGGGNPGWHATVTELWTTDKGASPHWIRTFPGRPEGIYWEGDRLLYWDRGLRLPLVAGTGLSEDLEVVLESGQVWVVPVDAGEETPLPDAPGRKSARATVGEGKKGGDSLGSLPGISDGEGGARVRLAIAAMVEGVSLYMMGYSASQGGDFRGAATYYTKAADRFEQMPATAKGIGISKPVCQAYAQALRRRARASADEMGRSVCADHLAAIGAFLKQFASAHKGRYPERLEVLKGWIDRRDSGSGGRGMISQAFRAPVDVDPGQGVSYGYRVPQAADADGTPVAWSLFYPGRAVELVRQGEGYRVADRPLARDQMDSLLAVGVSCVERDSLAGVAALEGVSRVAPNWAQGFCQLGYACLKAGLLDRAEVAFQRAINLDRKLPEAHYGMGLVFIQRPKGLYAAIDRFQEALKWNPKYIDARFRIAEARLKMEEYDARSEAEKVIALDPNYAPVYRLMGQWYEEQMEDYESAALWYTRYLSLKPKDPDARARLGKVYLLSRDFEKITGLLMEYVQSHPDEVQALPILAQACMEMRRLDWAQTFFRRYLDHIVPAERAYFEDIRLVAFPEEVGDFESSANGQRERFLKRFWAQRDPNLLTEANERQLEHYRRVWFARQNFSTGKQPWDRRGEVYIRFGEPDHRSRSSSPDVRQSLEVQRIKERMAREIYGNDAATQTYLGPVYPVRSTRLTLSDAPKLNWDVPEDVASASQAQSANAVNATRRETRQGNTLDQTRGTSVGPGASGGVGETGRFQTDTQLETIQEQQDVMQAIRNRRQTSEEKVFGSGPDGAFRSDFLPVTAQEDASIVRWESWIYTRIGGGIEITFTDENGHGAFDYAPPPLDAHIPLNRMSKFNEYAPQRVFERAASVSMDHYVPRTEPAPFYFYYNVADFRGEVDGRSALEVYYGIPRNFGKYMPEQDTTRMVVERQVALLNLDTGSTYRDQSDLVFQGAGDLTREPGAFVPDLARLEVPPGRYRMEVSARDRLSGRMGVYRQDVEVGDYARGRLRLSSLELAWKVTETGEQDKFTKRGMRIIPLPTRAFRKGQNIYVYYEVYNLKRDAGGLTNQTVEYTVRNSGGIFSRIARTFTGRPPEVSVSQGQVGTQEAEYRYIELDLKGLPPGKGYLTVTVKDLNGGGAVAREMVFTMVE